jgi:F0F1-type ATP synthase assembly protein I
VNRRDFLSKYGTYLYVGLEIAVAIAAPILIGYWLDNYLGTTPWLLLAGCLIGMANVFLIAYWLQKKLHDGS